MAGLMVGSSAAKAESSRFGYVDSIRGIAALSVIYLHMARYFIGSKLVADGVEYAAFFTGAYVFDTGKIAVALFFAISGFVVPFSLLRSKEHPIRDFTISRIFRLYPAYWISLPFGFYLFFVLRGRQFGVIDVTANLTMLQQFVGRPNAIEVYWTLQIEIIFYLLCVILFLCKGGGEYLRNPKSVLAVGLGALALTLAMAAARFLTAKNLPVAVPMALSLMFFGMLWRFALIESDRIAYKLAILLGSAIVIAIPVMSLLAYNRDTGFQETWYRYTLSYYAAFGLFLLLTARNRITHPAFYFLGRISYSVYLIGPIAQELIFLLLPPVEHREIPGHLYVLATMLLTVLLSWACYTLAEKPAIALGKRLSAWLDGGERRRSPATEVI